MEIRQCESPNDVAVAGANFIVARATEAIAERGQFTLALSGGRTPWIMFTKLAEHELPWNRVRILQVDERVAADGDADRNLVQLVKELADPVSLPPENMLAMPVVGDDLEQAASQYEQALLELAGDPPILDVVHLGLGGDGHTASLVPGDPVLSVSDRNVATTEPYNGHRRMTLTYPIINRARQLLWLIAGEGKAEMLARLVRADPDIPAGRVSQGQATVVADAAALSRHGQD